MYALILTAALLGQENPHVKRLLDESSRASTERDIQRREAAAQQQLAEQRQDKDRTNTYIIGGAIVAGLVLLGLLLRPRPQGGRRPYGPPREIGVNPPLWIAPPRWMSSAGFLALLAGVLAIGPWVAGWESSGYAEWSTKLWAAFSVAGSILGIYWLNRTTFDNRRVCRCPACGTHQRFRRGSVKTGDLAECMTCKTSARVPPL